jgi:hypothetical protein
MVHSVLGDRHALMNSRRAGLFYAVVLTSMARLAKTMSIFTLKIDWRF